MHRRQLRKRFAALGIVAVASVTIAACGSGSPSSTTSTTTSSANAAAASGATGATGRGALVACLKRNGAALPIRPFGGRRPFGATGASGRFGARGVFGGAPGGTGATGRRGFFGGGLAGNSKLAKAFAKCRGLAGGFGGRFGGRRFATGAAGFTLSAADRAELTRFVACMSTNGDSLPTPNLTSGGSIFTGVNTKSSAFRKAYAACGTIITFIRRPTAAPPAA
jgi:hypothetical protein